MTVLTRDMRDFLILNRGEAGDNDEAHEQLDLDEIQIHEYEIRRKIGEGKGNMRDVYVVYNKRLEREEVAKIPKRNVKRKSFQTAVALSKQRDWNGVEHKTTQEIRHPNLSQTVNTIVLSDGRRVNFELFYNGPDLESFIESNGPIKEDAAQRKLSSGLVSGLEEAHARGIIHRDLKPSNVIIQLNNGIPVITDLQTAKWAKDEEELFLPTRGSDAYTPPNVLEAAVNGRKIKVGARNDVYGLGAILYNAFTGERVSNLRIREDPNGNVVKIGDDEFRVALYDGEKRIDDVGGEFQDAQVERARKVMKQKKVSRGMISFIENCLSRAGYNDMGGASKGYQHLTEGFFARVKRNVAAGAKWFLPGLGAGAVTGAIVALAIYGSFREPPPKLKDIMSPDRYERFSLKSWEDFPWNEESSALSRFVPAVKYAQRHLPEIEASRKYPDIEEMVSKAQWEEKMDPRLVSAWIRACYLSGEKLNEDYTKEGDVRLGPAFVPDKFLRVMGNKATSGYAPPETVKDSTKVQAGVAYLKLCLNPNDTAYDTFARYFSTQEDIASAQRETDRLNLFEGAITTKGVGGGFRGAGNFAQHGYISRLPPHQAKLIEMATALYLASDEDGKLHFENLPDPGMFSGYDPQRYGSKWRD
jgi:serine/threonine protein kinase